MPRLGELLADLAHDWRVDIGREGEKFYRYTLARPDRIVLKTKNFGPGRVEAVVTRQNLQRLVDAGDPHIRPRGLRYPRPVDERVGEDIERSKRRARSRVRDICLQMGARYMATLTTRKTLDFDVLLTRFQRFVQAYRRTIGAEFLYCAVPEPHPTNPGHWHLHVALASRLDLWKAQRVWWSLCGKDFAPGEVIGRDGEPSDRHGNIHVKEFVARHVGEDVPSIIAGYIAKYAGKNLDVDFNRRSFWSSRRKAVEVNHIILESDTFEEAFEEVGRRMGVVWSSVCLTHKGCFFVLPESSGFWFKLLPSQAMLDPPF